MARTQAAARRAAPTAKRVSKSKVPPTRLDAFKHKGTPAKPADVLPFVPVGTTKSSDAKRCEALLLDGLVEMKKKIASAYDPAEENVDAFELFVRDEVMTWLWLKLCGLRDQFTAETIRSLKDSQIMAQIKIKSSAKCKDALRLVKLLLPDSMKLSRGRTADRSMALERAWERDCPHTAEGWKNLIAASRGYQKLAKEYRDAHKEKPDLDEIERQCSEVKGVFYQLGDSEPSDTHAEHNGSIYPVFVRFHHKAVEILAVDTNKDLIKVKLALLEAYTGKRQQ